MNRTVSYSLASLTLCSLVFGWWIGGWDYLLSLGPVTAGFCIFIFFFAAFTFVLSFRIPTASTLGSVLCPGFGLLGTTVGITVAMQNTENPEMMLDAMGLAFHATVVGIFFMLLLTIQEWLLHHEQS